MQKEAALENKITVVIPNYNGAAETLGCIASALQEIGQSGIVVVDDGSTDDSVALIRRRFPGVRQLLTGANRGFAHAANMGLRAATTPYVFMLNNDARLTRGALGTLLRTLERSGPSTLSVQAKMLTRRKPRRIDDCGDLYCALGWAFSPGRDADPRWYARRAAVTSACAGAALYRREEALALGGFDEAHFCYLEDVDLGLRARLRGMRNLYEPDAICLHKGSATSGSRHNPFKVRLTSGNNLFLLYKNFPLPWLLVHLPWLLTGIVVKGIYFQRKGLLLPYLAGLRDGLRKIRAGTDRRICVDSAEQALRLLKLTLELHLNDLRRLAG